MIEVGHFHTGVGWSDPKYGEAHLMELLQPTNRHVSLWTDGCGDKRALQKS